MKIAQLCPILALAGTLAFPVAFPLAANAADGIRGLATIKRNLPVDTVVITFNLQDRLTIDQIQTTSPGQRAGVIIDALKAAGFDAAVVALNNLNVNAANNRVVTDVNKAQDKEAFDVNQNMVVKVPFGASFTGIMPVLLANGAKQPVYIRFWSSKLTEDLGDEMALEAMQAAKTQAQKVAKALGVKTGVVIDTSAASGLNINANLNNGINQPVLFGGGANQTIPVQVSATVTLKALDGE